MDKRKQATSKTNIKNPQKEEGFTAIANELVEAFAATYLTISEFKTLFALLRKTYGYQKTEDRISITQFQKMTKLNRQSQVNALKGLVKKDLLVVKPSGLGNIYRLQKDYLKWPSQSSWTGSQTSYKKLVKPLGHTKENTKEINTGDSKIISKEELAQSISALEEKTDPQSPVKFRWQDEALRTAEKLEIRFPSPKIKTRWLGLFKEAYERGKQGALTSAYAYVIDNPGLQNSEQKIRGFLWKAFDVLNRNVA